MSHFMNMPIDTVTIAFIELRSRLHGLTMRLLRNESDAQDTLQDAWLRLHRHGCPDSTDEARRKLPVVVRNLCIDRLRDRRLHPSADCDEAFHKIENISNPEAPHEAYDVVDPVCESSDVFGKDVELPLTRRGDLILLRSAGAYGEIMASGYNCRPLPLSYTSDSI